MYDEVQTAWDLLGHRWTDDDVGQAALAPFVAHNGEVYELASGRVIRKHERWWMRWLAWREPDDDPRLTILRAKDSQLESAVL